MSLYHSEPHDGHVMKIYMVCYYYKPQPLNLPYVYGLYLGCQIIPSLDMGC